MNTGTGKPKRQVWFWALIWGVALVSALLIINTLVESGQRGQRIQSDLETFAVEQMTKYPSP